MKYRSETYTNSVLVATAFVVFPGLGADRDTIPADGATIATLHYRRHDPSETTAAITVNGAASSLALDANGDVEFGVTANAAGPIEVVVNADTYTVTAV